MLFFQLEDSLVKRCPQTVSAFAKVFFLHLLCHPPLMIPTLAMVKMSTMSWHIFLRMSNCSLFENVVANTVMLPLCLDFLPARSPHVNVDDHKQHLVMVAVGVESELSAAPEP